MNYKELICEQCHLLFKRSIRNYNKHIKDNDQHNFCSTKCAGQYVYKQITSPCGCCSKPITRKFCEAKSSKTGNIFCNRSCAATYHNMHKTKGTRVSKLEIYIQDKLKELFPKIEFDFNRTNAINSELDIYIPSLKLAFELNGIFHYEPIHGPDKLLQIQNNDNRKFQACLEQGIELCIIDSSSMKNFKIDKAKKYYTIICDIINLKK